MAETSINNSNSDMFETPGQVLRMEREQKKLSIEEIAKRIHLDVKIIEAIENDSSEGMPAAIYVRGYLRSYAKIVNVDADKIIELYNTDSPPPPEILPEVKQPTQVSSNDKPVKAFTYLITLGLVLLLLIWYQSNFVVDSQTKDGRRNNTATSINGVDITSPIINHLDSWQLSTDQEEKQNIDIELTTPLLTITDDVANLGTGKTGPAIEKTPIKIAEDNSLLSTMMGQGPDTIEMKLSSDSWVEIYDVKNKRLFHRLALAGEQYSIKGTGPLTITLGFSKGVTIKYNGQPFNIAPHSRAGVAHFILPE